MSVSIFCQKLEFVNLVMSMLNVKPGFLSVLQMQTIYLPPGGKVINVPGVGQTIYLPGNSAGISRAPPTKGPYHTYDVRNRGQS